MGLEIPCYMIIGFDKYTIIQRQMIVLQVFNSKVAFVIFSGIEIIVESALFLRTVATMSESQ